jgi:hypothetical protein
MTVKSLDQVRKIYKVDPKLIEKGNLPVDYEKSAEEKVKELLGVPPVKLEEESKDVK